MAPRPLHSPHPRQRWLALGLALLAVSCGTADQAVTAGSGPGEVPLPTLPSVAERQPGRFDDGGCAATPDGSDCSVTAAQIDAAQAGTAGPDPLVPAGPQPAGATAAIGDDWRMLAGFVGPGWGTDITGAIVVLDETVTASTTGPWTATGLVRNETATTAGEVVVEADLLDAAGGSLGVVSGPPAVASLRPGEPGPFALQADPGVPAESVASVRWSVRSEPLAAPPVRDLELVVYWQRGTADPRTVDLYLHHDPASGARPLVVFGTAAAVGEHAVPGTHVVGAWMDPSGRVIALADATLGLGGEPVDRVDLAAGDAADFVLVVDGAPPGLDDASLVLWGSGS